MSGETTSLRDYEADRHGPFLGISDDGTAAKAIRDAAAGSPKALAGYSDPFVVGVAHDAERLRSVGEVPVGPDQYQRIAAVSADRVLMTTNVGSHVNIWHYLQPPGFDLTAGTTREELAVWAAGHAHDNRVRDPQPWLRLRVAPTLAEQQLRELSSAAAAVAPVALAVRTERGVGEALQAIEVAAAAGAEAVVVDGVAVAPTEGRPALPGLLNYYTVAAARQLLDAARQHGMIIEPALKIDAGSVANQIWAGLHTARAMGLHLGKYGLFPLTFQDTREVVRVVQGWMADWTAAPAFYIDAPWVDGYSIYEPHEALTATSRWLEIVADAGAHVVLIDTVDKAAGRHLLRTGPDDADGIFGWEDIDTLNAHAESLSVKVLWAGGLKLAQLRELGRRRVFGVYVTTAASEYRALIGEERRDIGLIEAKEPTEEKIRLVRLMLDAGFLDDPQIRPDVKAAEHGDPHAIQRLTDHLTESWRLRLAP